MNLGGAPDTGGSTTSGYIAALDRCQMPKVAHASKEDNMRKTKASRGEQFAQAVRDEFDLGDPAFEILLDEIASVIDEIDALPASEAVERRLQRTLLSRLLGQLALPGEDDGKATIPAGKSVRGRAAALARWRKQAASAT